MGDLMLTASGAASCNCSLGLALGRGLRPADVLAERTAVTEGVFTAPAALAELPVTEAVAAPLAGRASVAELAERLMGRPARGE